MDPLLEARQLRKAFGGIPVLHPLDFTLRAGEVHALMGENGAGKSTLARIFAGLLAPDGGELLLRGKSVQLRNPHAALKAGIAMIHQELMPFPSLSVAENVWIGQEPTRRFPGWIDRPRMHLEAGALLDRLGCKVPTHRSMSRLSVAEMQVVEIAKALAHQARVLIMDEPTSALTEAEARALFKTIQELRDRGVAILYISHKFEEVFSLAQRITVLRDGHQAGTGPVHDFDRDRLIRLMVGRDPAVLGQPRREPAGRPARSGNAGALEPALAVKNLSRRGAYANVSFELRGGEVVGIAGLLGAGRTELLHALFGLNPPDSGEIRVFGQIQRLKSPRQAQATGIGLVTEDRAVFGLVPTLGVAENITLAALDRCTRAGIIQKALELRHAQNWIDALRVRTRGHTMRVNRLSGGNQQKVVIARTLMHEPRILLLDEPTRGIDVGAKAEIHALIKSLAGEGKAVLLVSSDLPELLALSQRVLVMRQGGLVAELEGQAATAEQVMHWAVPS